MSQSEPVVPNPESNEEKWFLESHLRELRKVIVDVAYCYGMKREHEGFYRAPRWADLSVWWNDAYGCVDLAVRADDWYRELRVFGRNRALDYSQHFDMKIAIYTDELLSLFLPGIRIRRSIRQCAMPIHFGWDYFAGPKGRAPKIDLEPRIGLCANKDGRWFCYDCEERYSLPEPALAAPGPVDSAAKERAKLTNKLRFEILARDNFACGICGRSPRKGDDVKLHVDHKMPVAKGGKTEAGNLWVLCQACNLGKSDRIVAQLTLDL